MVYQILVNVINTYNVLIEWYMILIHGLHAVSFLICTCCKKYRLRQCTLQQEVLFYANVSSTQFWAQSQN